MNESTPERARLSENRASNQQRWLAPLLIAIVVALDVAKNFGKGAGFGIGLAFLGFIFYPILGFGDAEYNPEAA